MPSRRTMMTIILGLGISQLTSSLAQTNKGEPGWTAAKDAVEAWYKKELPTAKVEEIAPAEEREILADGELMRSLRAGSADARRRRGRFVG